MCLLKHKIMHTEEDTFNFLRRTPITDEFLNLVDTDMEMLQTVFVFNIEHGVYDEVLIQHGWSRDAFLKEYCRLYNAEPSNT